MLNKLLSLFKSKEIPSLDSKNIKRSSGSATQTIIPKTENENFTVIQMPELSSDIDSYKVSKWLVKNHQNIKEGDILAEIETDKAIMEFESFRSGKFEIIAKEGTILKAGEIIAKMHH